MKKSKTIFYAITVLCIMLCALCFVACSDEIEVDGLHLVSDGDGYRIVKIEGDKISGNIVIPDQYNGKPITSIGDMAFKHCGKLTSVNS